MVQTHNLRGGSGREYAFEEMEFRELPDQPGIVMLAGLHGSDRTVFAETIGWVTSLKVDGPKLAAAERHDAPEAGRILFHVIQPPTEEPRTVCQDLMAGGARLFTNFEC